MFTYRSFLIALAIGIFSVFALRSTGVVEAASAVGAVYTMTNAADGNEIAIFTRAADGTLTPAGTVKIESDGSLTPLAGIEGLPDGANGLAAY